MIDLSIIIVSWNCREYLEKCLQSIAEAPPKVRYEIIVVDNASTDETVAMVGQRFTGVRLIASGTNLGFGAANNLGMKRSDGRYLFLLNPDTMVLPGALDGLVRFMEERPESMIAGPVLLSSDRTHQNAGVRFPSNWNLVAETLFLDRLFPKSRLVGRHKELFEDPTKPREIEVVHGAAMMVRREVLGTVGGLDEEFFVYFEETDWCWRIRKAGGKVHYTGSEGIIHFGGSEPGHFDERRLVFYHRSLLLFYRKHYSPARLFILRPLLVLRSLIRIVGWTIYALLGIQRRSAAFSCIKGYVRTIGIALT